MIAAWTGLVSSNQDACSVQTLLHRKWTVPWQTVRCRSYLVSCLNSMTNLLRGWILLKHPLDSTCVHTLETLWFREFQFRGERCALLQLLISECSAFCIMTSLAFRLGFSWRSVTLWSSGIGGSVAGKTIEYWQWLKPCLSAKYPNDDWFIR